MPSTKEIARKLRAAGWYKVGSRGGHDYYMHKDFPGTKVTLQGGQKELSTGTVALIEKQSGTRLLPRPAKKNDE